jgi:hypothetical protein
MNVQQALGVHTSRQEPGWKKTRHILEKQTKKRKHPELPRWSRMSYASPNAQTVRQTSDNQLSQITAQIMTFPNHVRSQGLLKDTLEAWSITASRW